MTLNDLEQELISAVIVCAFPLVNSFFNVVCPNFTNTALDVVILLKVTLYRSPIMVTI